MLFWYASVMTIQKQCKQNGTLQAVVECTVLSSFCHPKRLSRHPLVDRKPAKSKTFIISKTLLTWQSGSRHNASMAHWRLPCAARSCKNGTTFKGFLGIEGTQDAKISRNPYLWKQGRPPLRNTNFCILCFLDYTKVKKKIIRICAPRSM